VGFPDFFNLLGRVLFEQVRLDDARERQAGIHRELGPLEGTARWPPQCLSTEAVHFVLHTHTHQPVACIAGRQIEQGTAAATTKIDKLIIPKLLHFSDFAANHSSLLYRMDGGPVKPIHALGVVMKERGFRSQIPLPHDLLEGVEARVVAAAHLASGCERERSAA
jgi:hypothetical protein